MHTVHQVLTFITYLIYFILVPYFRYLTISTLRYLMGDLPLSFSHIVYLTGEKQGVVLPGLRLELQMFK